MECSVFLRDEHNRWCLLGLDGFDNVHGQHSVYLLFFEFPRLWPCSILGWMYRSAISLIKLNSVVHRFGRINMAIPDAFKLREQVNKHFAMQGVFVWYRHFVLPIVILILVRTLSCVVYTNFLITALQRLIVRGSNWYSSSFFSLCVVLSCSESILGD